jgi:protein-S-isoprenylcysteine O-methyltransferase Ste14
MKGHSPVSSCLYCFSISLYLIIGCAALRIVVRRSYRLHGRLCPLAVVLQGLVFFSWGFLTWADLPPRWPLNPISSTLRTAGWVLVLVGFTTMVVLIVWFDLRRAGGWQEMTLVRAGPYAVTRNPQLLACLVAAVGYVLLWLSLRSIGWLLALMAVSHMMVLTEEEHLLSTFASEYQEYCQRVPRYFRVFPARHEPAA